MKSFSTLIIIFSSIFAFGLMAIGMYIAASPAG